MVNVVLVITSCRIYAAWPFDLSKIYLLLPLIVQADTHSFCHCKNAVSFHAVSFGLNGSLMRLHCITEIAKDVQNSASRDPLVPAATTLLLSYTRALNIMCAHVLPYPDYTDTYGVLICMILGPTRRD